MGTSALEAGKKAPSFHLLDQNEKKVKLSDYEGRKLLVYFYPKANTPGCTTQSCNLRDASEDFSGLGVDVVGISPDKPSAQLKFDQKHSLGFPLLSDPDHKTAKAFGAFGEKKMYGKTYEGILRSSFLIDEQGKIIEAWYKVSPKDTVPKAMAALEAVT